MALAGGVLSLVAAYNLYQALTVVDSLYQAFGYVAPVTGLGMMSWLGIIILAVEAVVFLAAFPALRDYKKSGWNLVFWAALLSALYSIIVSLFSGGFINIGQLIFMLLGAAFGLYLLFQVRPYFTAAGAAAPLLAGPKEGQVIKEEKPADKTDKEV